MSHGSETKRQLRAEAVERLRDYLNWHESEKERHSGPDLLMAVIGGDSWCATWQGNRDALIDLLEDDESDLAVGEKCMALPLDADGVPIRDGDRVKVPNAGGGEYDVFAVARDYWVDIDGFTHKPTQTVHVKPRTIEDVLEEFADLGERIDRIAAVHRYADEIRELLGGAE